MNSHDKKIKLGNEVFDRAEQGTGPGHENDQGVLESTGSPTYAYRIL